MPSIRENIDLIRSRISSAAKRAGRAPEDVTLLAATKNVPADLIAEAIEAGIGAIGENRVKEAEGKSSLLKRKYPEVAWHLIGHLQTNKVKNALEIFDIIGSIDSFRLADEVNKKAGDVKRVAEVFIEVNVSGEPQKYGCAMGDVESLVEHISALKSLKLMGFLTVPPLADDPEMARPFFRELKNIRDRIGDMHLPGVEAKYLSMGMTDDYEIAVEEGSDIVRIGRGIFGSEQRQ